MPKKGPVQKNETLTRYALCATLASAAVAIRRVREHFVAMAGTGYDEKQSGQLLLLEHHYKKKYKKVLHKITF